MRTEPVPQVHLHPRVLAVFRRGEVRVVDAAAVLRLRVYRVTISSGVAEVVLLKVARALVEPMPVQLVVNQVVQVEEILNGHFPIGLRRRSLREIGNRHEVTVADGIALVIGLVVAHDVEVRVDVVPGDMRRTLHAAEQPP